ncbi:nuclear transport factor 2 family protein [Cyanobium sp. FGCU-52]|nr:nuclear transport factor 2 family protein [Cyanobium sp. FGCU52]
MTSTLQDAADAFYEAGNRLLAGDATAYEAIWSDADDISLLGPTGARCIGRQAVMEQFAREAAMGFSGSLVADDRRTVETAEMGLLVCTERTSGMTRDGEPLKLDIRSTTVFRKEQGHWRVVHHHTDRF